MATPCATLEASASHTEEFYNRKVEEARNELTNNAADLKRHLKTLQDYMVEIDRRAESQ